MFTKDEMLIVVVSYVLWFDIPEFCCENYGFRPTTSSQKVGYMYEFDCKPVLNVSGINTTKWLAIAFEHKQGYVTLDPQIQVQTCPGDPSSQDIITTPSPHASVQPLKANIFTAKPSSYHTTSVSTRTITMSNSNAQSYSSSPGAKQTTSIINSTQGYNTTKSKPNTTTSLPISLPTSITYSMYPRKTRQTMKSASFNSVQPISMARSTLVLSTNISSNISSSMTTTTQSTKSPFMVRSTPVTSAQTSILSMTSSSTTSQSKGTATTSRPTPATSSKPTTVATTNRQSKTTIYTTPQSTSLRPTLVSSPRQSTATTTSRPATVTMTSRLTSLTTNQLSSTKAQSKVSQTPTVSTSTAPSSTQPSLSPSTTATSASQATTTTGGTTVASIPQLTMQSSQLGNTGLCSSSVVQYVKSDNELLAQLGDSCYTLVPHRASWSHAESVCSQRGGHLFHIANQNQNNFFYNLLSDHFYNHSVWLGLHDIVREGHFQWTSSDPVNYTNWALGRNGRFNNHFVEDCVVFLPYWNHGQWDDVQCGATSPDYEQVQENHYFICQFRIENVVPVNPIITGTHQGCPSNVVNAVNREGGQLTRYGERCYERVPQPRTWDAAEQDCRNKGGHLVHIGSSKEENDIQEFLRQFGGARFAVWIGLNDQAYEGVYVWSSGERLTYTNWLVGQLNHHGLEDCVLLVPYNYGGWDDVPCGQYYVDHPVLGRQFHTEIHPYICEYHVVTAGSPVLVGK